MEASKSRPYEIVKEIDERRERRKAKEMARTEKIRAINLQKYNKDNPNKSVFLNDKSQMKQSQPKNFNSMTDIRQNMTRKSIITTNTLQSISTRSNIAVADQATFSKSGNNQARKSSIPQRKSVMVPAPPTAYKHQNETDRSVTSQRECIAAAGPSTANKSVNIQARKSIIPQRKSIMVAGPLTANKLEHNRAGKSITSQRDSIAMPGPSTGNKFGHNQVRKSVIPQGRSIVVSGTSTANKSACGHARKSIIPQTKNVASGTCKSDITKPPVPKHLHANVIKKPAQSNTKGPDKTSKLSVFERLYQPKRCAVSHRKDGAFERKTNTVATHKREVLAPIDVAKNVAAMRRSISAVHFKRIGKHELSNCFHRFSSVKDLNQIDLNEQEPKPEIVNSIRSDRKKVKFLTATPRADELQSKLKNWLEKRGKTLSNYPHLRCFGVHRPMESQPYDEENKENISAEISDDGSFNELRIDESPLKDDCKTNWRRASLNDSEVLSELSKSMSQSPTSMETPIVKPKVDQLLLGALTDLSQLIREGYDWEQCARWLRCVRSRWPHAPTLAAYWECRAALEECRGDLPRSFHCWEEAIAKGTESSVAEASLDQLLDKFMQLNINPSAGGDPSTRPHNMSAKSALKSTLIRFAVMNAKAKETSAAFTVTPVRRSHRLSVAHPVGAAPALHSPLVQLAASLRHIDHDIRDNSVFVPNKLLQYSP